MTTNKSKVLIDIKYNEIVSYNEDKFVCKENRNWYIKNFNEEILYTFSPTDIVEIDGFLLEGEPYNSFIKVNFLGNKMLIFDLNKLDFISDKKYYLYHLEGYFNSNERLIRLLDEGEGLMDFDGNLIFEPIYKSVCYLKEINIKLSQNKDGLVTAYDLENNLIWQDNYITFYFGLQEKALMIAKKQEKFGIVNALDNSIVITIEYESISNFENNLFIVKKNGKCGILNSQNTFVLDLKYTQIISSYGKYLGLANEDKFFAIFDIENKTFVSDFIYTSDLDLRNENKIYKELQKLDTNNDTYQYEENGKVGLKNKNNEILIPAIYNSINGGFISNSNIYEVADEEKIGYYNIAIKKEIIPLLYDYTNYNGIGGAYPRISQSNVISVIETVEDISYLGFYTIEGKKICDAVYDRDDYPGFVDNYCSVSLNNLYGLIDINGQTIIPFEYSYITYPHDHKVIVQKNGKYGIFALDKL